MVSSRLLHSLASTVFLCGFLVLLPLFLFMQPNKVIPGALSVLPPSQLSDLLFLELYQTEVVSQRGCILYTSVVSVSVYMC